MFNSNLISFCIPTCNRSEILAECLSDLISKIKEYNFEIIISDNHSVDDTEDVVKKFQLEYENIKYIKQEKWINVDENFALVLSSSKSVYTWLIGDSYRINSEHFAHILTMCNSQEFPLILVNSFDMIKSRESCVFANLSDILHDLGWYLPFMSAYIYRTEILMNARYEKYYYSNFLQMGIVFDYFENKKVNIYWFSKNAITSTALKKQSWHNESLKVFGKNWTEFILSLPRSIELVVKLKCIKDHGEYHKLFTLKNLLNFRERGWLSYQDCCKYKVYFDYISIYPWIVVASISLFPRFILSFVRRRILKD